MLAIEVDRVFTTRKWSYEQAERQTGISAATLRRMRLGFPVKSQTVVLFGEKVGEGQEKWGRIALGLASASPDASHREADPLSAIGVELDPRPYGEALAQIAQAGAGLEKWSRFPTTDGPLENAFEGVGPIRVFKVVGDCMEPVLHNGDEIILTAPSTVEDGDIVTATVDVVNVTCKRIRIPGGEQPSYLEAINGEGTIPEGRFAVTGVVRRVIESIESRMRRERGT